MSNIYLKSELPDTLVEEQKQYELLKLKGNSRSITGSGGWTSTSSGTTYNTTTGDLGIMQQLAVILYDYHIAADDWNALASMVYNAANPVVYAPTLNSPWTTWQSNDVEPVHYYKDISGRIFLSGMITSNNTGDNFGSVIFTLPTGYRIAATQTFIVEAGETGPVQAAQIYVHADGNVIMGVGNNSVWISLSTVSFLAAYND